MGIGGKTFKEVCEVIAESNILSNKEGINPTPEQVFDYSPTGELFMLWEWYEIAVQVIEHDKTCGSCREGRRTGITDGCPTMQKDKDSRS